MILSPRLQSLALTPADRVSLFVRKLFHFRPDAEPFKPRGGECQCGRPGTHKVGSEPECDECQRVARIVSANPRQFHPCDVSTLMRLTAEEAEESRLRRLESWRVAAWNRRQLVKSESSH